LYHVSRIQIGKVRTFRVKLKLCQWTFHLMKSGLFNPMIAGLSIPLLTRHPAGGQQRRS